MKRIFLTIYGACLGSPGLGVWACILRYGEHSLERFGGSTNTTKARMELQAALEGFKAMKEASEVQIVSNSQQLLDGFGYWLEEWRATHWIQLKEHSPDPIPDADLWKAIDPLTRRHILGTLYARQLSSSIDVKRCEELAVEQVCLRGEAPRLSGPFESAA
jgi:ribonuclease HI